MVTEILNKSNICGFILKQNKCNKTVLEIFNNCWNPEKEKTHKLMKMNNVI